MSYRTYIEKTQVFGNNEYYKEWADFIESQGIEIGEDGDYDGEITDIQGMFDVIDKITKRLIKERHERVEKGETWFGKPCKELADLTDLIDENENILLSNMYMIENAYCFLPYQVYKVVEEKLEEFRPYIGKMTLKLKPNEKIHVCAG